MKRVPVVVVLLVSSLPRSYLLAQQTNQSVSLQPILLIEHLIQTEVVGFSAQYERSVLDEQSALVRFLWFGDPLFRNTTVGPEGVRISAEYCTYLSDYLTKWHLGPFVEGVGYRFLGSSRGAYGDYVKTAFEIGAQVGVKILVLRYFNMNSLMI